MAKQIKNRREDIYINEVPPEILTEAKLSADGFVKNTDYATSSTAGVVRGQVPNGIQISNAGFITAATRSLEQYENGATSLIIGKGTLENVIASLIIKAFIAEADPTGEAADGTKWNFSLYKQTGEYIWLIDQIIP